MAQNWSLAKQKQLDDLLRQHTEFREKEFLEMLAWFQGMLGTNFTIDMLDTLLTNATQAIHILYPWKRN